MNNNDKYFFPLNYKFSSKLLGIIEYKVLLPISILLAIIIATLYVFKVDFFISFAIVLFISVPSILLLSTGINGQPAIPYLKAILKYSRSIKVYIYR